MLLLPGQEKTLCTQPLIPTMEPWIGERNEPADVSKWGRWTEVFTQRGDLELLLTTSMWILGQNQRLMFSTSETRLGPEIPTSPQGNDWKAN